MSPPVKPPLLPSEFVTQKLPTEASKAETLSPPAPPRPGSGHEELRSALRDAESRLASRIHEASAGVRRDMTAWSAEVETRFRELEERQKALAGREEELRLERERVAASAVEVARKQALVRRTSLRSRVAEGVAALMVAVLAYATHALVKAIDDYQHRPLARPCTEARP